LTNVIIAVSLLAIPALARIVRASTLQVADRDFVKAAQVLGVKKGSILVREVLPNVMPTLVSFAFLTFGIILVAESSLSFLGLSVEAPTITWGSIIAEGRIKFSDTPHMVFLPGAVLFLTVLSLNFVGDQLLKRFDIKESGL
jgi:peptide/nickel transport system permease protein